MNWKLVYIQINCDNNSLPHSLSISLSAGIEYLLLALVDPSVYVVEIMLPISATAFVSIVN